MNPELLEAITRVTNSITRVPDRLSTPDGESIRAEYARIFSDCIVAEMDDYDGLYLTIPFQASLLTDPVMFIVSEGLILLDHPTQSERYEFALNKTHIIQLNRTYSLYEDRYPRLIIIPKKRQSIKGSWMIHRLRILNFIGPFGKELSQ